MSDSEELPSNSKYAYVGLAVCLASFLIGWFFERNGHMRLGMFVGFIGFGLAWASCAVAQLVTGYSWQNLEKGNRGPRKNENPRQFWITVGIDLAVFTGVSLLAVRLLLKE